MRIRNSIVAIVVVGCLAQPAPAHAGIKAGLRKVAHVATRTVEGIAVVVAIVVFCSSGGCN